MAKIKKLLETYKVIKFKISTIIFELYKLSRNIMFWSWKQEYKYKDKKHNLFFKILNKFTTVVCYLLTHKFNFKSSKEEQEKRDLETKKQFNKIKRKLYVPITKEYEVESKAYLYEVNKNYNKVLDYMKANKVNFKTTLIELKKESNKENKD